MTTKNLIITKLPIEYRDMYLDLCDAFELTRNELLVLLMTETGLVNGGIDNVIKNKTSQEEWRSLIVNRIFTFANSN